jgi:hypothetical protein
MAGKPFVRGAALDPSDCAAVEFRTFLTLARKVLPKKASAMPFLSLRQCANGFAELLTN